MDRNETEMFLRGRRKTGTAGGLEEFESHDLILTQGCSIPVLIPVLLHVDSEVLLFLRHMRFGVCHCMEPENTSGGTKCPSHFQKMMEWHNVSHSPRVPLYINTLKIPHRRPLLKTNFPSLSASETPP